MAKFAIALGLMTKRWRQAACLSAVLLLGTFLVQTIDNVPQPSVLNIEGRRRKIKPSTALPVLSLSILGNELYVLSGVHPDGTADKRGKVMDVYNKQDGNYLYSWELPADGQEAIVASNYIYIRSGKEVTVWSFKSNS